MLCCTGLPAPFPNLPASRPSLSPGPLSPPRPPKMGLKEHATQYCCELTCFHAGVDTVLVDGWFTCALGWHPATPRRGKRSSTTHIHQIDEQLN